MDVLTWSNVGTKLVETVTQMKTLGRMPTPEECNTDNKNIAQDGLTNYTWLMREAIKFLPGDIATAGKPVRAEYKGKSGTVNNFGEFTPDGEKNPNEK